ncbi:hypothetical protein BJ165DRAFT_1477420 [Panaeolus papilionaceus]|nr:hypothetical protein BJ165DRAFT_1477420 [Panaeolus papilionaceus]
MPTLGALQDSGPVVIASAGTSSSALKSRTTKAIAVRDDWEDDEQDDDEEQPITRERNKQIWEDANTRVVHPMPAVILVRAASTAASTVTSPSLPLNQPPSMRILKRPSPSVSPTQSGASNTANAAALQAEALKERERKYQEARERIFGASSGSSSDISQPPGTTHLSDEARMNQSGKEIHFSGAKKTRSPNPTSPTTTQIIREPRGPGTGPNAAGFGDRRTGPSSVSSLPGDQVSTQSAS